MQIKEHKYDKGNVDIDFTSKDKDRNDYFMLYVLVMLQLHLLYIIWGVQNYYMIEWL